ncbi:metal ABC transporter solute-binding protein, Zn/Mn family [Leptolyngbya ohadii]|uniref:metal ABC transporter solute-binding protein, Zn/Mn family n=1 Tax=Leptolyngbya ohadii TaxID=1962290 RepID=UPI000B5A081E|nr:zinc ABC transporter substrate-binding protein [Leptolyngbya ohadii]
MQSRDRDIGQFPARNGVKALSRYMLLSIAIGAVGLTAGLTGCGADQPAAEDGKPNVVSTSTMISDWTAEIAGEEIDLTSILKPGDDPHVYEATPADTQAMEDAQLILYNGYNLEPGLIRLVESAGANAKKLAVGEVVKPLEMEKEGQTVPDPHVWGNVKNTIAMVQVIRDALIELSPDDRAQFTQNADRLIAELEQLNTWIDQQVATIPPDRRKLVTTHDAFQYYANAYGLTVSGTLIGISTEEQPSAQTVQKLVESVKGLGIPSIFAETTINPQLITTVAEESGVKLAPQKLYSDSIGAPGSEGDSYVKMMVANTKAIVENLGGRYTPFNPSSP